MSTRQVRQYQMLVRVWKFYTEHRELFPDGSEGAKAFAAIMAAIAQFEAGAVSKDTKREDGKRLKAVAREAVAERLAAIARNARVLGKSTPGVEGKFQPPVRRGNVALLTTARAFLKELPAVKDALINCGLPGTFVEDLQKATDAFEQALSGREAARIATTADRAGIREALLRGVDAAKSLDVLVANVFGGDARTTAAWKSLRHVEASGRKPLTEAPSQPTAASTTPLSTSEPTPAPAAAEEPLRKAG